MLNLTPCPGWETGGLGGGCLVLGWPFANGPGLCYELTLHDRACRQANDRGDWIRCQDHPPQDFLLDSHVQAWLDGLEPAWTLLTFESLQALRHEPAATRTAIRIANDLSCDEIAGSPIARNTLILLRAAIAHGGLPLTGGMVNCAAWRVHWPAHWPADVVQFPMRTRTRGAGEARVSPYGWLCPVSTKVGKAWKADG